MHSSIPRTGDKKGFSKYVARYKSCMRMHKVIHDHMRSCVERSATKSVEYVCGVCKEAVLSVATFVILMHPKQQELCHFNKSFFTVFNYVSTDNVSHELRRGEGQIRYQSVSLVLAIV